MNRLREILADEIKEFAPRCSVYRVGLIAARLEEAWPEEEIRKSLDNFGHYAAANISRNMPVKTFAASMQIKRLTFGDYAECVTQDAEYKVDEVEEHIRNAYEVWAGSEGLPTAKTATEAYLLHLIEDMVDELSLALNEIRARKEDAPNLDTTAPGTCQTCRGSGRVIVPDFSNLKVVSGDPETKMRRIGPYVTDAPEAGQRIIPCPDCKGETEYVRKRRSECKHEHKSRYKHMVDGEMVEYGPEYCDNCGFCFTERTGKDRRKKSRRASYQRRGLIDRRTRIFEVGDDDGEEFDRRKGEDRRGNQGATGDDETQFSEENGWEDTTERAI